MGRANTPQAQTDRRRARSRRGAVVVAIAVAFAAGAFKPAAGQRGGIGGDMEVAGLLDEIEASTAKHERLDDELRQVRGQRARLQADLGRHVRALYRVTHWGRAPVGGGFDAVLRHVARVKRLRQLVSKEARQVSALTARAHTLRAETGKLAGTLEATRRRLADVQSGGARAGTSFDDVFSGSNGTGYRRPQENFYGLRVVDPTPTATFASERGRLSSPVSGEVRVSEARRQESDGPGLEFRAPAGTAVRAVAPGRVAFSDHYGSYGRIVILDHGDGYYTVYGGLGAVEVRVGDDLSRRARIGSIGGDSAAPALFFEVRHGTRTLSPHEWLGF